MVALVAVSLSRPKHVFPDFVGCSFLFVASAQWAYLLAVSGGRRETQMSANIVLLFRCCFSMKNSVWC